MSDYRSEARSDARATVEEFKDTILEQLEEGDASPDLHNDYPGGDRWHHESHVDRYYNLTEAAECIDQLSEHEETDSGLWEGQQPREAIGACAAYTYGNAVYSEWRDLIKEINNRGAILTEEYDEKIQDAEEAEMDTNEADYTGTSSDNLREEKTFALTELIDEVANG